MLNIQWVDLPQDNASTILNPKGEMKGSTKTGPVAKEYMSANFTVCSLTLVTLNFWQAGPILPLMQSQAYEMLWASCFLHEIDNPICLSQGDNIVILYSVD